MLDKSASVCMCVMCNRAKIGSTKVRSECVRICVYVRLRGKFIGLISYAYQGLFLIYRKYVREKPVYLFFVNVGM